jgi:Glycosyl transferases group 1
MSDFAEIILKLDENEDYNGIIEYIPKSGINVNDILYPVYLLLRKERFRSAYILFKFSEGYGANNYLLFLAQAFGGLLFGNPEDEQRGCEELRKTVPFIPPEQILALYKDLLEPCVRHVANIGQTRHDRSFTLRTLDLMKAAFPLFDQVFNWNEPIRDLDINAIREEGRRNARLIDYQDPPADARQIRRRAVVAAREFMFPNQAWSRPLDIGPRIAEAMAIYGWDSHFYGMQWRDMSEDYQGAADLCRQIGADVLVLDDHMIDAAHGRPIRAEVIAQLRHDLPGIKIVGAHFDTWALERSVLVEASQLIDVVWDATSPSLDVWEEPSLQGKVLHCPYPHAVQTNIAPDIVSSSLFFSGSVKGYNWHRAFWLAAADRLHLPLKTSLSTHSVDGLPVLESYGRYMQGLADSTCALNFSMRPDLSCIVTGRSFETPYAGALQVQEDTPDMEYYFTVGEHYLSFRTFSDLRSIIRFIAEQKDEAEAVRRRGADFARQRYSDEKIIGYLDYMLHYQTR